jgi:hypothetical protein
MRTLLLCLFSAMIIFVFTAGCTQAGTPSVTQPVTQPADQNKFMEVTATQPDATHIIITYQGGPNMMKIMELETTVTDSSGKSQTKSIGSRLATTPITIHGTDTLAGSFEGKDHVVVMGYFSDGSRSVLLDTTL